MIAPIDYDELEQECCEFFDEIALQRIKDKFSLPRALDELFTYSIDSLFRRTLDEERMTSLFDRSVPEIVEYYTPFKKSADAHGIFVSCFKNN